MMPGASYGRLSLGALRYIVHCALASGFLTQAQVRPDIRAVLEEFEGVEDDAVWFEVTEESVRVVL